MVDHRPVLVTGAFGNVGRHTLRALLAEGRNVVATDLRTKAAEATAREFAGRVETRWADLTDRDELDALVSSVAPRAVLHLAAMIPPSTYVHPDLARKVNVDAVAGLVAAVERLDSPAGSSSPRASRSTGPGTRTRPPPRSPRRPPLHRARPTARTRWRASGSCATRRSTGRSCASGSWSSPT